MLAADREHLRAVGVRGEELHVVDAAEVLPARVADLAVVADPRRDRVREVLRGEAAIGVAAVDGDRRELRDDAAVLVLVGARAHRRVHLVRHERDATAGDVDRVDVVAIAAGLLVDLELAVAALGELRGVDVVAVVRVALHREDDLLRVERDVRAVEVGRAGSPR